MAKGKKPPRLLPARAEDYGDPENPPICIQLALEAMGLAEPTWKVWKADGLQAEMKTFTSPNHPQGATQTRNV